MTFDFQGNGGNCNGCEWIAARGEITADTPDAFRSFLAEWQDELVWEDNLLPSVMFDSSGGNLGAAIELGRLLRKNNARTIVGRSKPSGDRFFDWTPGGECTSACVFAFLGGATRWVGAGELGVHQFYAPDNQNVPTAATQRIMGDLVIYLIEMGISPELLSVASNVRPDDMLFLDEVKLQQLLIATTDATTPMQLEARQGGLVAAWQTLSDTGSVDRYHYLRCSISQLGWLLTVRDTGIAENNYVISEAMHVTVGGVRTPLDSSAIVELRPVGQNMEDTKITVRLPMDLRKTPEAEFVFETNDSRNFSTVLSATGQLPDSDTLETMVRACGL